MQSENRCAPLFYQRKGEKSKESEKALKSLVVRTTQRYNDSNVWAEINPVLLPGEMGIESDTNFYKFGDGATPWNELGYVVSGGSSEIEGTPGGYYTPSIAQPTDDTLVFYYDASKGSMPAVAPVTVTLPQSEGTEVVANPGAATQNLSSISIDGTSYNINGDDVFFETYDEAFAAAANAKERGNGTYYYSQLVHVTKGEWAGLYVIKTDNSLLKIDEPAQAAFTTDETLSYNSETKVLSVNTTDEAKNGNKQPITSNGVYQIMGDLEVILTQI